MKKPKPRLNGKVHGVSDSPELRAMLGKLTCHILKTDAAMQRKATPNDGAIQRKTAKSKPNKRSVDAA